METSNPVDSSSHNNTLGGLDGFDLQWLIARCKKVCLQTDEAWTEIKAEGLSIAQTYSKFIAPLAIAGTLVSTLFITRGTMGFFLWMIFAVLGLALKLAGFYIGAIIIEFLAPMFGGRSGARLEAFKLMTYSSTPSLVTSLFCFTLLLQTIAGILSLFGLYILWHGITPMVEVPVEKRPAFIIALIVVGALVMFAVGMLMVSVVGAGAIGGAAIAG